MLKQLNLTKDLSRKIFTIYLIRGVCSKCIEKQSYHKLIDSSSIRVNYQANQAKLFSTTFSNSNNFNKELGRILTKAEKVVGYPTSFLNLRYLVSDEVANFANLLRKLIKTKHPLIDMARTLISSDDENKSKRALQINGLIVLLISKAAGIPRRQGFMDVDISDGIHNSQRCLAEITEMIYMGSVIHKGLVEIKEENLSESKNMDQGNKLAVLCGDYLLASACNNLSKLQNTEVVDLMSQVIADLSQSIFINQQNSKFSFLKLWYEGVNSNTSSLLANSAKGALLLVKHSPRLQEIAWHFAKNLDLTHKIWSDLSDFKDDYTLINKQDTVMNAIYRDKYEKEAIESENVKKVTTQSGAGRSSSYSTLISSLYPAYLTKEKVINEILYEKIYNDCKSLFQSHYEMAFKSLHELENENSEKEAVESLRSILHVMNETVSQET